MYDVSLDSRTMEWVQLDFPGVSMKILHTDPGTNGMSVLTKMNAGATIPAHIHTSANETVYVLEGVFIENGVEHDAGWYFACNAGIAHGPHTTDSGCMVLTTFSSELDFVLQ